MAESKEAVVESDVPLEDIGDEEEQADFPEQSEIEDGNNDEEEAEYPLQSEIEDGNDEEEAQYPLQSEIEDGNNDEEEAQYPEQSKVEGHTETDDGTEEESPYPLHSEVDDENEEQDSLYPQPDEIDDTYAEEPSPYPLPSEIDDTYAEEVSPYPQPSEIDAIDDDAGKEQEADYPKPSEIEDFYAEAESHYPEPSAIDEEKPSSLLGEDLETDYPQADVPCAPDECIGETDVPTGYAEPDEPDDIEAEPVRRICRKKKRPEAESVEEEEEPWEPFVSQRDKERQKSCRDEMKEWLKLARDDHLLSYAYDEVNLPRRRLKRTDLTLCRRFGHLLSANDIARLQNIVRLYNQDQLIEDFLVKYRKADARIKDLKGQIAMDKREAKKDRIIN